MKNEEFTKQDPTEDKGLTSFYNSKFKWGMLIMAVLCAVAGINNLSSVRTFIGASQLVSAIFFLIAWFLGMQFVKIRQKRFYELMIILGVLFLLLSIRFA